MKTKLSRAVALATAALVTTVVLGSELALFHSASAGPWLPGDQAALVSHCDGLRPTQRQACLQAAIASLLDTHVARR